MLAALVPASLERGRVEPTREDARLSSAAHRLHRQAESQYLPTARAQNAGRRQSVYFVTVIRA